MSQDSISIERTKLEEWQRKLEQVADGTTKINYAFTISEEMYDMINAVVSKPQSTKPPLAANNILTFKDIAIGTVYKVINSPSVRSDLRDAEVQCVEKGRTKVVVVLLTNAGKFTKGMRVKLSPSLLQIV